MGCHLRVLCVSYPMNTNTTGFRSVIKNLCILMLWTVQTTIPKDRQDGSWLSPCLDLSSLIIRDGDRKPVQTGLSIAVNQSKTGPPYKRFGFLCMLRVPGGVIKLSAPTSSLASQCLPSAMIKQSFQNLSSLVRCPLSLCSEAFWG